MGPALEHVAESCGISASQRPPPVTSASAREGPNTGGMGAFAPTPFVTPDIMKRIHEESSCS